MKRMGGVLTINPRLNGLLDTEVKDLPLSPNLHNPPQLLLNLIRSSLIGGCSCLGDDGRECDEEIVLVTGLGLLCDL